MVIWIRVQVVEMDGTGEFQTFFKIEVIRFGDDLNVCAEEDKYQQDLVGGWKVYSLLNRWWYSQVSLQCQRKRIEDKFGFGHVEFQVPLGSLGRESRSHSKI